MKLLILLCAVGASFFAWPATQPFVMGWKDNAAPAVDVSFLSEKPAGKDGFIRVENGHFVTPRGQRFRIWGINFTAAAAVPNKADSPAVAAHLARFGLNCVRFHFLDNRAPQGLIDAGRGDSRALDPKQLDRLDFFIAELKKQGIYADLNLNVGRRYTAGDGVRDYELIGFAKALTYFDERLLTLQREYARALLTHYNPYTKSEYRNEPAVLLIEMVNENSIVEAWANGRLLGENTRKNPGTWTDIPASYEEALTQRYQEWLRRKGQPPVPRLQPKQFASAPEARFRTEAAFYMELEDTYFQSMRKLLKEELGVKSLLVGTRANPGASGYALLHSASRLDIVDAHTYWQHPHYLEDPATGKRTGFTIPNSPMVNEPLRSTIGEVAPTAVAGKPFIVSEVNHPAPSEYACEGIPVLAAYAALQDWDGILWYTFEHKDPAEWKPQQPSHFEIRPDPVKMAELAAGALMFLRGDVSAAREMVTRSYTLEQVYESIRQPRSERSLLAAPLQHATRAKSLDGPPSAKPTGGNTPDPIVSDTGELTWKTGLVTVDAPRSQALVGFVKANPKVLSNLSAQVDNDFCAIVLSSLDGSPISKSKRMLLVTGSRVANTGMTWDEKRKSLTSWGTAPTLIEPVAGTVVLRNLAGASRVEAVPLDSAAHPIGQPLAARKIAAGWEIRVGEPATPWFEIRVR